MRNFLLSFFICAIGFAQSSSNWDTYSYSLDENQFFNIGSSVSSFNVNTNNNIHGVPNQDYQAIKISFDLYTFWFNFDINLCTFQIVHPTGTTEVKKFHRYQQSPSSSLHHEITLVGYFDEPYNPSNSTSSNIQLKAVNSLNLGSMGNQVSNVEVTLYQEPDCAPPKDFTLDNSDYSNILINWEDEANHTGYNWKVVEHGDDPTVTSQVVSSGSTTTSSVNLTELAEGIEYQLYVDVSCGVNNTTEAFVPFYFITPCPPVEGILEYFSGTEVNNIPICWSKSQPAEISRGYLRTGSATGTQYGSKQLQAFSGNWSPIITEHFLVSPKLDVSDFTEKRVVFSAIDSFDSNSFIELGVMSDNKDFDTFTSLGVYQGNGQYKHHYHYFEEHLSDANYIAFKFLTPSQNYSIYLDRVVLEDVPSCFKPSDVEVQVTGAEELTISWVDDQPNAVGYEIAYGEPNFDPDEDGEIELIDGAVSTHTLTGLDSGATYDIYVKRICDDDSESSWSYSVQESVYVTGDICIAPIAINNLPYTDSPDPTLFSDLHSSDDLPDAEGAQFINGAYTGFALNGREIVYSYSPEEDEVVNFSLDFENNANYRLLVFESCPFQNLIGFDAGTFNVTENFIEELHLESGKDYYIVITPINNFNPPTLHVEKVDCPKPFQVQKTEVTISSVTLSWNDILQEEGGYEYHLVLSGEDLIEDNIITEGTLPSNSTSIFLDNLSGSTAYDFYIKTNCSEQETSVYDKLEFYTECEVNAINYFEDFTGFTGNLNTGVNSVCWAEGRGFFDTTQASSWNIGNFANDADHPNGDALRINLWLIGNEAQYHWVSSEVIDLGEGSSDNILSFDAFATPFSGNDPVTDFGSHEISVIVSEDGGETWDLENTIAFYSNNNLPPNSLDDTYQEFSLADYSGEIKIGFYAKMLFTNPDLLFYIDNLFVGEPSSCISPEVIDVSFNQGNTLVTWEDLSYAVGEEPYQWFVYYEDDNPEESTPVTTGITSETSIEIEDLTLDTNYKIYIKVTCEDDEVSQFAEGFPIYTGYCVPFYTNDSDYIVDLTTTNAEENIVSNPQTSQAPNGYGDLTDEQISVFAGSNFSVQIQNSNSPWVAKIWMDINHDFEFSEDEVVAFESFQSQNGSLNVQIPEDMEPGTYRMRLRTQFGANSNPESCGGTTWGEARDYTIEVLDEFSGGEPTIVQIINNTANPEASNVDIFINGEIHPSLINLDMGMASSFIEIPSNAPVDIAVVPSASSLDDNLISESFIFEQDSKYILVINDLLIGNADFELSLYEGAKSLASNDTEIDVLFHNGLANAVNITLENSTLAISNLDSFGFSGYHNLVNQSFEIGITSVNNNNDLGLFELDLPSEDVTGKAITILLRNSNESDLLSSANISLWYANQNGGSLVELPQTSIGVEDFEQNDIKIYPVPVTSDLTIESIKQIDKIEVFNTLGQKVIRLQPYTSNISINMQDLSSGLYFIKMNVEGAEKVFQVIKN